MIYGLITFLQFLGFKRQSTFAATYFFGFLLVFVAGLRGEAGFDIHRYYENWWIPAAKDWLDYRKEPILHLLFGTFDNIGFEFWHAIFFCSLISIILKVWVFTKTSPLPFWSLVIYYCDFFYFQEMGQFRSGIAMAFILLSFYFLINNKQFLYFLTWLLACMIHISAFPTIVMYVIFLKIQRTYSFWALSSLLIMTIGLAIFLPLQLVVENVLSWLNISGVYGAYILRKVADDVTSGFGSLGEMLSFVILCICWYYFRLSPPNKYRDFFFLSYFIGFLFLILASSYGDIVSRIARNFLISSAIIVPYLYESSVKDKVNFNILYLLVLFYGNLKIALIFLKRGSELYPHGTFL